GLILSAPITNGRIESGTYTIDASQLPAHLDLLPKDGPKEGKPWKVLYKIDGDTLRLAQTVGQDPIRPKSFSAWEAGVSTWKRERQRPKSDQEAIQGQWKVIDAEIGGWREPKVPIQGVKFVGDKLLFRDASGAIDELFFTLDETKKPKQIDWTANK